MRNLFVIAVMLLGAFMAGWFTIDRDGDHTTIEINRNEIREDTREVIDRGRELLHQHEAQAGSANSLQEQAVQLWNQGTAAAQSGNWGEVGQAAYQNFATEPYHGNSATGAPPTQVQPWQQVAPSNGWQYAPTPQGAPYQQPYAR